MVDANRGERFIFVGGAERSGTTLVQNILGSHPDICGAPEFHHLPDIIALRKKIHISLDREYIDLICSYGDVDQYLCSLIESFLYPLADQHQCRYLSEKTPSNVLVFPELIRLFPAARFIHVVRDPRAIIASMFQVGKRAKQKGWKIQPFTRSISAAVAYVRECQNTGFASLALAPDRVCEVLYERLVVDPEQETKRICEFLGLEWSNEMIHPKNVKHLGEKAVTNDVWYDAKSFKRDPVPHEVHKWKHQLSHLQKIIITTAFLDNEGLARCGYHFSAEDTSFTSRILSRALGAGVKFARYVLSLSSSWTKRFRAKAIQGLRLLYHMGDSK